MARIVRPYEAVGGRICLVQLLAPADVLRERATSASRLEFRKLGDPYGLGRVLERYDLTTPVAGRPSLTLDGIADFRGRARRRDRGARGRGRGLTREGAGRAAGSAAPDARPYDPQMPGALFAVIVVAFVVVGVVLVRRTIRGAVVSRLPLEDGEHVVLEEEGLKLFHRVFQTAAHGGGTTTYRVRSILTDRRVLLATGGPEGKHRFVILLILDYTTPSPPVPEHGYAAYKRKFGLRNGFPTYGCSAGDFSVEEHDGQPALRAVVPFPEGGEGWGDPPEIRLSTPQASRYLAAIGGRSRSEVSTVEPDFT
ncbi:MAG TPA: hypothetical protein VH063_14865 [Gaiellaceae bacterium]|nr:hypothetical protein [Gaiellaceae bacterium]